MNSGDRKGPRDAVVRYFGDSGQGTVLSASSSPFNPERCSVANFAFDDHSKNANGCIGKRSVAGAHVAILLRDWLVVV